MVYPSPLSSNRYEDMEAQDGRVLMSPPKFWHNLLSATKFIINLYTSHCPHISSLDTNRPDNRGRPFRWNTSDLGMSLQTPASKSPLQICLLPGLLHNHDFRRLGVHPYILCQKIPFEIADIIQDPQFTYFSQRYGANSCRDASATVCSLAAFTPKYELRSTHAIRNICS
jgi:hypothetical protein